MIAIKIMNETMQWILDDAAKTFSLQEEQFKRDLERLPKKRQKVIEAEHRHERFLEAWRWVGLLAISDVLERREYDVVLAADQVFALPLYLQVRTGTFEGALLWGAETLPEVCLGRLHQKSIK